MNEITEGYMYNNKNDKILLSRKHLKFWWINYLLFLIFSRIISSRHTEYAKDYLSNTYLSIYWFVWSFFIYMYGMDITAIKSYNKFNKWNKNTIALTSASLYKAPIHNRKHPQLYHQTTTNLQNFSIFLFITTLIIPILRAYFVLKFQKITFFPVYLFFIKQNIWFFSIRYVRQYKK